jgi:hypothetical protein
MAEARPALDLTTEPDERPIVKIDQVGYQLRIAKDLSLMDFKFLERVSIRVGTLLTQSALTKNESTELAARLKEVTTLALDAPAAVLDRLTDVQRVLVFKVFTELLTPGVLLAARAIAAPSPFHGTKQSRGSAGSIPGRRTKDGRRGRRTGSSKPH